MSSARFLWQERRVENEWINKAKQSQTNPGGRYANEAGLSANAVTLQLFSLVYLAFFSERRRPGESCLWSINTYAWISQSGSVAVSRLCRSSGSGPESPPGLSPQSGAGEQKQRQLCSLQAQFSSLLWKVRGHILGQVWSWLTGPVDSKLIPNAALQLTAVFESLGRNFLWARSQHSFYSSLFLAGFKPSIHSFIHPSDISPIHPTMNTTVSAIHSFIHPFIQYFIHHPIQPWLQPCICHSFINPSIHPSLYSFIHHLFIFPIYFIHLFIQTSIWPFIHPSIHPFICPLFAILSIHQFIHTPFLCLSTISSICTFTFLFIHPCIHSSTY